MSFEISYSYLSPLERFLLHSGLHLRTYMYWLHYFYTIFSASSIVADLYTNTQQGLWHMSLPSELKTGS